MKWNEAILLVEHRQGVELDKFYTNPKVAKECISKLNLSEYTRIIEPSAGSGSFSSQIPRVEAYDLKPEGKNIKQQDFLKLRISKKPNDKILVIGNPPFGFRSNLALSFINHAAEFADTIAMILPITFARYSLYNRINKKVHMVKYYTLERNSFTVNGRPYNVNCGFFIFKVKDTERPKAAVLTTSDFKFVKKGQEDFRIIRKGWSAGKIAPDRISDYNCFFIKSNINPSLLKNKFRKIDFSSAKNNVMGSNSLTMQEIIAGYNKV